MTKESHHEKPFSHQDKKHPSRSRTFAFAWLLFFLPFDSDGFVRDILSLFSFGPGQIHQHRKLPSVGRPTPDSPLPLKAGASPGPPISESGGDPANPTGDPPPN